MNLQRILPLLLALTLSGCFLSKAPSRDGPPSNYRNVNNISNATPQYLPKSKYGNPKAYTVNHITYRVLSSATGYHERGIASWYGSKFAGKLTSTRELYDPYSMTAASPVLPLPCFARVTNLKNGNSVIVKVNDRGPFAANRIMDLSYAAATKLGYANRGTALVDVAVINMNNPFATPIPSKIIDPRLYLQVGAFAHYPNAHQLKQRIAELTRKNIVIRDNLKLSHRVYRVLIGPFQDISESDKLHTVLMQKGLGNAVTVIQ